jgi:hypothetical protein
MAEVHPNLPEISGDRLNLISIKRQIGCKYKKKEPTIYFLQEKLLKDEKE